MGDYSDTWTVTASGISSATATYAADDNTKYVCLGVIATSDSASSMLIIKDGTNILAAENWGAKSAEVTIPLAGTFGNSMSATINGTATSRVTISGIRIPRATGNRR